MRELGEIFRRGMESTIANWPLVLIRVAETIAIVMIVIGTFAVAVIPLFVGAATGLPSLEDPEEIQRWLMGVSPLLVLYVFVLFTVVFGLAVLLHAFVQAGVFGVLAVAERQAPERGARAWFRAFTPELWWAESKRWVWPMFWIYNIVWGVAALVTLIPLIPALLGAIALRESEMIVLPACLGIATTVAVGLLAAFVGIIWSHVAFAEVVRTGAGAIAAVRQAGARLRARPGALFLVAVAYFALSMGVGMFVGGFTIGIDTANVVPGLAVVFLPLRIVLSLLNSLISAAFGCWMAAAVIAAVFPPREVSNVAAAP